ncbi:unnamed protein product [Durusdinium trenchii]|uniref:Uncharacterized protein n=1 Tax=Durusdinium trenchii TaxID=1381693 RepID=A0ABP0SF98_9DINO
MEKQFHDLFPENDGKMPRGVSTQSNGYSRDVSGGTCSRNTVDSKPRMSGWETFGIAGAAQAEAIGNSGRIYHLKKHLYMQHQTLLGASSAFSPLRKSFLRKNGFRDVNSARAGGCFFRRESLCPIHVAAQHGDLSLIEILLAARADPEKETSRGRTAMDLASEADMYGSHRQVLSALQSLQSKP